MRIAVVNWNDRKIGGAETYLAALLPALRLRGYELAFWCEERTPPERESLVPEGLISWSVADDGLEAALAGLREWRPDLLFVNGLTDPAIEAALQGVAPAVFYAHNYYGTCITGAKMVSRPEARPCGKRFGIGCLAHYYPRQCGGRSPLTMLTQYRVQARRLDLLGGYRAIVCASEHMRAEYVNHGLPGERVHVAPYPVEIPGDRRTDPVDARASDPAGPWRILCAGRIERQKGVSLLLRALPLVRKGLGRPLEVMVAGEGAERERLEALAARQMAADPGLSVRFLGWTNRDTLDSLIADVDVLALPSVWPEPFGMIGLEAGLVGVPTVAYAVGGIPDWLEHGVNGMLAPADPPTPEGIAAALLACADPATYGVLAAGARTRALRYTMAAHLEVLESVLAIAGTVPAPAGSTPSGPPDR